MRIVAQHLQTAALSRKGNPTEFDLFGRSAFNRYYYALFLSVRGLLIQLDSKWGRLPHKSIPEILTGQVLSGMKKRRKRAVRIEDPKGINLAGQAISAVNALSDIMAKGYSIRKTADYDPDAIIIAASDSRIVLGGVELTEAYEWFELAARLNSVILRAWSLPE